MIIENQNQSRKRLADYIYYKRILKTPKINLDTYSNTDPFNKFNRKNQEYQKINEMIKKCEINGIKIYSPLDNNLPILFNNISSIKNDLVFVKGSIIDGDICSYSICGTREPTLDGIEKTKIIAKRFAKNRFTLINGFAKGIDIEAFKGQIEGNGRYIGVLGSGLEKVYPPENIIHVPRVLAQGALISQRFIDERVNQYSLQIRNQLTAQMVLGSIFIEGKVNSGARWQLKFSKEANKKIFYLEPKDWNHPNAYICKLVRNEGGIQINNNLENLDKIISQFIKEHEDHSSFIFS